jgi:RNA polymerase sigma-70 factor, ECF subfamily
MVNIAASTDTVYMIDVNRIWSPTKTSVWLVPRPLVLTATAPHNNPSEQDVGEHSVFGSCCGHLGAVDPSWHDGARDNDEILETLYSQYGSRALGFATRVLRDQHLAEDVVQDSFIQVWRRAGSFDPRRGSVLSWLMAVVYHRCIDVLRGQKARPRTISWGCDAADRPAPQDTWDHVEQRLRMSVVRRAVSQLPREQREVIELGFFAGYSHREIAERLTIPLGTVKGRSRLALRRLRAVLEGRESKKEECAAAPSARYARIFPAYRGAGL